MRLALACIGLLLLAAFAPRAEALRCGSDLVREGDPAYQVQRACGEPDWVGSYYWNYGVREEIWHYNFGPNNLIRVMHFREGRLERLETAGRGYLKSRESSGCRPAEVERGMSADELLQRCGEPVQREMTTMQYRDQRSNLPHLKNHPPLRRVFVEDWFYEFGSSYLARKVRLMNGIVAHIETLD